MAQIFQYGGYGVNIKITRIDKEDPNIAWVRGNSFVVVDDSVRGQFLCGSVPVALLSVNGMGEIRWKVDARQVRSALHDEEEGPLLTTRRGDPSWDSAMHLEAFRHFGLTFRE